MRYLLYRQALWGGVYLIGKNMASLKQRRNKYYARVRSWDGIKQIEKQIPLKTINKTDAIERLLIVNKYEKDIKDGINIEFPWMNEDGNTFVKRFTLQEAIDEYLIYMKNNGCRETTVERAFYCLKNLSQCLGKQFCIEKINTSQIEIFKNHFKEKLTDNGININLTRIRAFLNWGKNIKGFFNIIPNIQMIRVPGKMPSYLNEIEQSKILEIDWLDNHYKDAFIMYWETGCRLREPFDGTIDGKWLVVNENNSKTGIPREILMNSFHIATINEMKKRLSQSNANPRTFTTKYSRMFKKCCITIGRGDLHFHNLRDTYALMRYLKTRDIYQVSKELGHTSVKVTEKYTKFRLRKLEQDFPNLTIGFTDENRAEKVIRDTYIRDTNITKLEFIEGRQWN